MRRVSELSRQVVCHEHVTIAMRDGARLAARMWLPEGAEHEPVPAILEYIPYRKRDLTRRRDDTNHPYLAAHGYACIRVDMRGSGESDGVLNDQYLRQEQEDGVDVIAWIAEQAWCSGRVGMFGISWGGIAALQVAALRPPALHAIISSCSTDNLYTDNMHYMGGCLLTDNLSEATTMFAMNACPPDPALVGERWRDLWMERLRESGLWLAIWLKHQRRNDFWKAASICENYAAINCPVLTTSGWADGFTNAVFRLLQHLEVPCHGLVGPWGHAYPHLAEPGPRIGFLQECIRWFDHWLKDLPNGVEKDPVLRVWMQDSMPPQTEYRERPGRWVTEPSWPSPNVQERSLFLDPDKRLIDAEPSAEDLRIRSPLTVGLFAGKWCSYSETPDLPADQRLEDGGSLVFETTPLNEDVEILGTTRLEVEVASNRPQAMLAARISDVRPDGSVTRITYGLLNLSHREGHAAPRPMRPDHRELVRLTFNGIAQRFSKGHRIRLSLSTSYWPLAWPSPVSTELTLCTGVSRLILPVRRPRSEDELLPSFKEPEACEAVDLEVISSNRAAWTVHHELSTGTSTLEVLRDDGHWRIPSIDWTVRKRSREWYSSTGEDPHSARGETRTLRRFSRGDWSASAQTRTVLTSDAEHFHVHAQLDAYEDEQRILAETWNLSIPRDHI